MTTFTTTSPSGPIVLVGSENGITVIPTRTPLARLNYFDGKFLRASDLSAEQRYLRSLVELSNRAGGHGIAHGFEVAARAQGELEIAPGLAIDPEGRVLLLPVGTRVALAELIEKTRLGQTSRATATGIRPAGFGDCIAAAETPPSQTPGTGDLYLITIAHAEALCGEEDVYGKLCQEACITSTDRPFRLEGIVVRARPLILSVPLPTSGIGLTLTHWRSRVASACFEDERRRVASLISKAGLESDVWCHGAVPESGTELPLAVVGRVGTAIQFLDLWTVRRERIDTPARRYWQWRMAMRPWDVFLAHILQFQCQLNAALSRTPGGEAPGDPCREAQALVREANVHLEVLRTFHTEITARLMRMSRTVRDRALADNTLSPASLTELADFGTRLTQASAAFEALPSDRILIDGGIVELPSAGYLPVVPGSTLTVNQQVRRLLGEGVDLRFCIVRPDYVAHALEEAQHLERISLLTGLDHPTRRQEVDVLVPYGQAVPDRVERGRFYEMRLNVRLATLGILASAYSALHGRAAQPGGTADPNPVLERMARIQDYVRELTRDPATAPVVGFPTGVARTDWEPDGALAFSYAGSTAPFSLGGPNDNSSDNPNLNLRNQARAFLWMTLDLGRDPFEIGTGSAVAVRAESHLLLAPEPRTEEPSASRGNGTLVHASFVGNLQVEGVAARPGSSEVREIRTVLSGTLTFSAVTAGERPQAGSLFLTERPVVVRTQGPHGPGVRIELPEPSILAPLISGLEVRRDWSSVTQAEVAGTVAVRPLPALAMRTLQVRLDAALRAAGSSLAQQDLAVKQVLTGLLADIAPEAREAFLARQLLRPEVIDPTHPAHASAIGAIHRIGTALGSARFSDLAARRLFPAPTAPTTDLGILATLDWVLFHRRREKQCRVERPAPRVQTRTYLLYRARLSANLQVAQLAEAVNQGGDALRRFELQPVRQVEFAAGIHAVETVPSLIEAAWRTAMGPDAGRIEGGVIASRGLAAAEGEPLALRRLAALVEVVSRVTPIVENPAYLSAERVPDGYAEPGHDGIAVIATVILDAVTRRNALLLYTPWDNGIHFVDAANRPPNAPMEFANDIPQGNALTQFIASLGSIDNAPIRGVTVAIPGGPPDAGASTRLDAVLQAVTSSGRPAPASHRRVVETLRARDRELLLRAGFAPDDFDDILYLEINDG